MPKTSNHSSWASHWLPSEAVNQRCAAAAFLVAMSCIHIDKWNAAALAKLKGAKH